MNVSAASVQKVKSSAKSLLAVGAFFALILVGFQGLSDGVKSGIRLFFTVIFPSVFPFMLLSDVLIAFDAFSDLPIFPDLFSRVLRLPKSAFSCFLIGLLCGFPLGARCAKALYENGEITKSEAEALLIFTSNPSLAFLVGTVGLGLCQDRSVGVLLFLSSLLSSFLIGWLLCRNSEHIIIKQKVIHRQKYSFLSSVSASAKACVSLFFILCTFCAMTNLIQSLVKNPLLSCAILSLLELGNAASAIGQAGLFSFSNRVFLLGFSVGFSGLSVFLQISDTVKDSALSLSRYLPMKVLQGVITGTVFLLLSYLK